LQLDRSSEPIVPGILQMENGGRGASLFLRELLLKKHGHNLHEFGDLRDCQNDLIGMKVLVVNGKGNNGGDGFVVARNMMNWGAEVEIVLLGKGSDISGPDVTMNYKVAKAMEISIIEVSEEKQLEIVNFSGYHAIVDGIFGTGLSRDVAGVAALAINKINKERDSIKLSLDIPSGLDASTGKILGFCVKADATATFGTPKTGLKNAPEVVGQLRVIDVSFPRKLYQQIFKGPSL